MAAWLGDQPLADFTVLETDDIDAARSAMTAIYGDVALNPATTGSSFSLRLNAVPLGRLLITSHRWESGVTAHSPALDGCFDFCSALAGVAESRIGRRAADCSPGHAIVMAPIHPMDCRVSEGMVSLCLKVPVGLVEAHARALTGKDIGEPLDFDPDMPLEGQVASCWRLVHYVVGELERNPGLMSNPLVREHFSETLLTSFLCSQRSNYSQWLQREPHAAEPRYVRKIEEYLDAHCDQPITARDLAEIAGVSMSALYAGFKRHRGVPPLEFLKQIRLHRVRDALLTAPPGTTVSEIASRWGFNHLGRFSGDYGRQFGETPSETFARAANRD